MKNIDKETMLVRAALIKKQVYDYWGNKSGPFPFKVNVTGWPDEIKIVCQYLKDNELHGRASKIQVNPIKPPSDYSKDSGFDVWEIVIDKPSLAKLAKAIAVKTPNSAHMTEVASWDGAKYATYGQLGQLGCVAPGTVAEVDPDVVAKVEAKYQETTKKINDWLQETSKDNLLKALKEELDLSTATAANKIKKLNKVATSKHIQDAISYEELENIYAKAAIGVDMNTISKQKKKVAKKNVKSK